MVRSVAWHHPRLSIETAPENPMIIVGRGVSLVQYIRAIFHHKLRPAECTMVMVPIAIRSVTAITTVNERRTSKIFVLSAKAPIRSFWHARGKDLTRQRSATATDAELCYELPSSSYHLQVSRWPAVSCSDGLGRTGSVAKKAKNDKKKWQYRTHFWTGDAKMM